MIKKIRSRAGSTLVELLATITIMAIVFSMLGGGISAIRTAYTKVTLRAEAQTALSTAIQAVEGDLRTAATVTNTAGKVCIGSGTRGYAFYYENQDSGVKVAAVSNPSKAVDLLSPKATNDGKLKVSIDSLSYTAEANDTGYFTVTVSVTADAQSDPESQQVIIRPMSKPIVS